MAQTENEPITHLLTGIEQEFGQALVHALEGRDVQDFFLDRWVTFFQDNAEEVKLRVSQIEFLKTKGQGQAVEVRVYGKANFQNVLKLAQKLNMKLSAFNRDLKVVLKAKPDLVALVNTQLPALNMASDVLNLKNDRNQFVFTNLDLYQIERISQ